MQQTMVGIQSVFLEQIRKRLPPNVSFADELAELLSISRDSAYRRLRGETVLSLDEARVLVSHFGLSMDEILSTANNQVAFQMSQFDPHNFSFDKWLQSILNNLDMLSKIQEKDKEMIYNAKDLPIFHYFQFPRLSAFKLYFWMKSFEPETRFNSGKYSREMVGNELITLGERVWRKYTTIPSTEIISYEMVSVTLRQILYAFESGMFADKDEAKLLCEDCATLSNHLRQMAQEGHKRTYGDDAKGERFDLYHNELLIGDNTILFKIGTMKSTFITPNGFHILMTSNGNFCKLTEEHISNLMAKSIKISQGAEKERSKFFNWVEDRIKEVQLRVA